MFYADMFLKVRGDEPTFLCRFGFSCTPVVGDVFMFENKEYEISERSWLEDGRLQIVIEPPQRGVVPC